MEKACHSIVMPVYNKSWLTIRCLNSVLKNTSDLTRDICVIDNGSSDDTDQVLLNFKQDFERLGWHFQILRIDVNIGFGRAVNRGLQIANKKYVSVLNNDTWLMPNWDEVLLRRIEELKLDMIAPYAYEKPFDEAQIGQIASKYVARNRGRWRRTWSSMLMLFRTQVIQQIGMFDERFFLTHEDTDLRERMNRGGHPFGQIGDCFIWHHSRGTRGEAHEAKPESSRYEIEAKKLFIEKWGFDPSVVEAQFNERMKRRWIRWKEKIGYF